MENGFEENGLIYSDETMWELVGVADRFDAAEVVIPWGVRSIGDRAFYECRNLCSVTLPDTLLSIGKEAFRSCRGNSELIIPSSVTSIGLHAFLDWPLKRLTFLGVPDKIVIGPQGYDHPFYHSGRTEIEIPEGSVEKFKKLFPKNVWNRFVYPKREVNDRLPKFLNLIDERGFELTINTDMVVKVLLEDDQMIKIQMIGDKEPIKVNRVDFIDWISYFK